MGCASSKPPVCRHCRKPCSPINRSYSMHVHHPPQRQGDSYHLVALTSSTLGSLKLDPLNQSTNSNRSTITSTHSNTNINMNTPPIQIDQINNSHSERGNRTEIHSNTPNRNADLLFELVEAKTWSKMIEEKIPKIHPATPVRTPPGEPETINAWELMEGLEDVSPLRPEHNRSFSFNVSPNLNQEKSDGFKSKNEGNAKPIWLDRTESDNSNLNSASIVSDFDADVIKTFRKTLEELPAANPFHLNSSEEVKKGSDKKEKVIVYFTSLRGVRKTYEDCCNVLVILKGLGIRVDERDVSMHSGFKEELKELLGGGFNGGGLPKVFIGKQCIGGAEDIRRWNEEGKLGAVVEGCETLDDSGSGGCEGCGDVRFVPCETCSGSCKIYYGSEDDEESEDGKGEGEEEEEEEEEEEQRYGFERCPDCNENGLIRCPICCDF